MQRFQLGRILKEDPRVEIREAVDSMRGVKVLLLRIQALSASSLRDVLLEFDTQRRLRGYAVAEIYYVDIDKLPTGGYLVTCAKEYFRGPIGLEIRIRASSRRTWSDEELVAGGERLHETEQAAQRLGVAFSNISIRNVMIRGTDIVLGNCKGVAEWSNQRMQTSQESLAVLLAQMALLQPQEFSQREGLALLANEGLSLYPRTAAFIRQLTAFRDSVRQMPVPRPSPNFSALSASLPAQQTNTCIGCNRSYHAANFQPTRLRGQYQRYPQYVNSVCSIACLDVCIQYYQTQSFGQRVCANCRQPVRVEGERMCESCRYSNY